ncbi:MAG: InlB B-repeat-containing protein, partial [Lachnospiraceae bacterium]|nr:InlB B-repeat-containing protein [Lachnospiraceae bacterium]
GVLAAKAPKLSAKKFTMNVGETRTIKVNNYKKKIKWKVSGKKIVKAKVKGKKKLKVTGLKPGKVTVKAVLKNGVTLKCKITVIDPDEEDDDIDYTGDDDDDDNDTLATDTPETKAPAGNGSSDNQSGSGSQTAADTPAPGVTTPAVSDEPAVSEDPAASGTPAVSESNKPAESQDPEAKETPAALDTPEPEIPEPATISFKSLFELPEGPGFAEDPKLAEAIKPVTVEFKPGEKSRKYTSEVPASVTGFKTPVAQTIEVKPGEKYTITFKYVRLSYSISISSNAGDKFTVEPSFAGASYRYGTKVSFTLSTADGYKIVGIKKAAGSEDPDGTPGLFTYEDGLLTIASMPAENLKFEAEIEAPPAVINYNVTVEATGSSVYVKDADFAGNIKSETVTFKPDDSEKTIKLAVPKEVAGFTYCPDQDSKDEITAEPGKTYTVDYKYSRNSYKVSIEPSDADDDKTNNADKFTLEKGAVPESVKFGADVNIKYSLSKGYKVDKFTDKNADEKSSVTLLTSEDNSLTFTMPAHDMDITADIAPIAFQVRYEGQGGLDSSENVFVTQDVRYDDGSEFMADPFTKKGYQPADHWLKQADDTSIQYKAGDVIQTVLENEKIEIHDSDIITVYSDWKAKSYKVLYHPGENAILADSDGKALNEYSSCPEYGISFNEAEGAKEFDIPVKKGYAFTGWYTDAQSADDTLLTEEGAVDSKDVKADGTYINDDPLESMEDENGTPNKGRIDITTLVNSDHDIDLYAHYALIKYDITYDTDSDGESCKVSGTDENFDPEKDETLPKSYTVITPEAKRTITPSKLKRDGYDFNCWYFLNNGKSVRLTDNKAIIPADMTGNITFRVSWIAGLASYNVISYFKEPQKDTYISGSAFIEKYANNALFKKSADAIGSNASVMKTYKAEADTSVLCSENSIFAAEIPFYHYAGTCLSAEGTNTADSLTYPADSEIINEYKLKINDTPTLIVFYDIDTYKLSAGQGGGISEISFKSTDKNAEACTLDFSKDSSASLDKNIEYGSTVTLSAKTKVNNGFYGWVNGNDVISNAPEYKFAIKEDTELIANKAGYYFHDLYYDYTYSYLSGYVDFEYLQGKDG